jgi:hypothetical protein
VAGAQVAIKGTGLVASTDEQGRFQLGRLPGGEYTLVAWPTEGKPKEKRITVPVIGEDGRPARDGDYDLEI